MTKSCSHCEFQYSIEHEDEHPGLCCDCMDLSCGHPLESLNEERAARGEPPITKEWMESSHERTYPDQDGGEVD